MTGPAAIIRAGTMIPCRPWPRYVLTRKDWAAMARALPQQEKFSLVTLWADTTHAHALFVEQEPEDVLLTSVAITGKNFPALSPFRPEAAWLERMIADLWGHAAEGGTDARAWLDHGRWPREKPLAAPPGSLGPPPEPPEFLPVDGDDLHQIALGPIYAGITEPGHFRVTAQGETVVRLETRLGYAHKGTLSLMQGKSPRTAARFAARLSGDSTVAHALAFARATEAALETEAPPRAQILRAVMAEMERVANHLGDVGMICHDAGFAFAHARFGFHREAMLRAADAAFGHRLMMDCVVPGGVARDLAASGHETILRALAATGDELPELERVYENHASLMDRMVGTGIVDPALAENFGAGGIVGRAAGRRVDARRFPGYPPYDQFPPEIPVRTASDVDARVRIRFAEIAASIRLIRAWLENLPGGALAMFLPVGSGEGVGVAEAFRGDAWHWVRLEGGLITANFMRDPSWAHWPLLEAAMAGNIVGDFPLCSRSINGSCSGVDL